MIVFFSILSIFALLFLILIFLISPSGRKHIDTALLKGAFIAHRGLHDLENGIPENSLHAFQNAVKRGIPIEIDLRLTKDEKVVVFHDEDGKRVCSDERKICDLTLKEIKELSLFHTKEKIPTLEECLFLVDGKVFLLIELKVDKNNWKKLCKNVNEILVNYKGKYIIQSFYPQVLYWYKKNQNNVCRGQLGASFPIRNFGKFLVGNQLTNFVGRPDFISFKHTDCHAIFFCLAVLLGAFPVGWTFETKEEIQKKKEHFDAYIYENIKL